VKVEAAVRGAVGGGSSREQLQQRLRQQAEQIAALEKQLANATVFPQQEQQRFAATATAMGLSYEQARELLKIVVKKNAPAARRSAAG
jgi:CRP-like cAMP-binding protein